MTQKRISRRGLLKETGLAATALFAGTRPLRGLAQAVNSQTRIRIAVVGGGFGLDFHWHEHPSCEVTGVSDLRPDRRVALQSRYQCETVYDSLESMLREARDIDAVAIFTEAPNHEKHVRMCMERGLHVISAVPACLTLEEAERLREVTNRTGMTYMMAETSYYRHYCIAARELYEAGQFGELFYSEVEYYHPHIGHTISPLSFHEGQRTWRYGYPPMLYPTHSTGLLVGVTGERFTEVSCLGWGNPENPALKDNHYRSPFNVASALFKTDRNHICRCNVFWDGTAEGERAQWFGTKLTFYMPGSGGQPFRLQGPEAPEWTELPDYWGRIPQTLTHNPGHGGSHPFLTHEFVRALLEEREPAVNLDAALNMTIPGIVAHESAHRGGEQLTIPQL
ncbi:MAG: Gfo/Idh/MocA family oxidoreductase [Acidobacteriota bacterium]|nr:MAG: Gfo/Idh/MocA family oxidoreductase [Acidobacteriota bacterium]